jgi:Mor family transcriptional regulator
LWSLPVPFSSVFQESIEDKTNEERSFSSAELLHRFHGPTIVQGQRLYLPFGHSLMVANSKSDIYATLHAAGRPIMDQLASDILMGIFELSDDA